MWTVYLSGEIHTDWRQQIIQACDDAKLNFQFFSPNTDHASSDECGVKILGEEEKPFWVDYKGASLNSIRTRHLIQKADIVVVRFGDKYRQWNAAFDAGIAAALGKSIITLHDPSLIHALKEINASAAASCESPAQVVEILRYISQA
ncbi:MAG: YtoQ family protein [Gammaproteobacteria bacterium]|nr:YtoQ family protein [Gammaproteobacteria bacterium]MDH5729925.1 YtoQ family protein [Gammaproteobacteria bacterium]